MEYISASEFLKQDEKVQRTLKEYFDQEIILYSFNNSVNYGVFDDVIDETPLLTESQIRKFIEDKTGCKLNVGNISKIINIYKNELDIPYETDLLQAYWKVAIEIAKEVINK